MEKRPQRPSHGRTVLTARSAACILNVPVNVLQFWSALRILPSEKHPGWTGYNQAYIHALKEEAAGKPLTRSLVERYYIKDKARLKAEREQAFSYRETANILEIDLGMLNDMTRSGFLPFTIHPDGFVVYLQRYILDLKSDLPPGIECDLQWAEVNYLDHQAQHEIPEKRQHANNRCRQLMKQGILVNHTQACELLGISWSVLHSWANKGALWYTRQRAGRRYYLLKEVELLQAKTSCRTE